jgi:beta-carotene/zeaxanthin 4-ketolase
MTYPDIGILFAAIVMGSWITTLLYCLFRHELSIYTTPFLILLMAHLDTGLFITAHDSIHGTVSKSYPLINRWAGKLCLLVFAGFDYDKIRDEHWRHHANAGLIGEDPDFHSGNPALGAWIYSFMVQYVTLGQVSRLLTLVGFFFYLGAPIQNLFLFQAVAAWASTFVLFYYGTYLPHMPDPPKLERPDNFRTLSKGDSRLTSFLKAYNFGCHSEHHSNPKVPWWALYDAHLSSS